MRENGDERVGLSDLHRLDRLLDIEETARILHVSPRSLYGWINQDPPKGPRVMRGIGKHLRFHPQDVRAYMDEKRGIPPDQHAEASPSEEA